MGNAITQESRAVWLALRRHGGWWTVKAITHHFRPTFAEFEVQEIVDGLVPGGYLTARRMSPHQSFSYCFTSECRPLPGADDVPTLEAA
jgi:hypothetical protein